MKACEAYISHIVMHLDGTLPAEEEQALMEHLSCCQGCRTLYETYKNIDMGIAQMEEEPPSGLCQSVMRRIGQEKSKSSPLYYIKRMKFSLTALAACLVLLLAGKYVHFPQSNPETSNDEIPKTVATLDADAPVQLDGTALIPAYDPASGENTQTVEDATDGAMAQGRSLTTPAMRQVLEALNQEGYCGDLVELFDMTTEDVPEQFPDAQTIHLTTGDTVYQISWAEFDAVESQMSYGTVVSTEETGESVFLWLS